MVPQFQLFLFIISRGLPFFSCYKQAVLAVRLAIKSKFWMELHAKNDNPKLGNYCGAARLLPPPKDSQYYW